jgi:hypothetical protein
MAQTAEWLACFGTAEKTNKGNAMNLFKSAMSFYGTSVYQV